MTDPLSPSSKDPLKINSLSQEDVSKYILEIDYAPPQEPIEKNSALQEDQKSSVNLKFPEDWVPPSEDEKISIYIAHGLNEFIKEDVVHRVKLLGLNPILEKRSDEMGLSIIQHFNQQQDIKFAMVILTPDDLAHAKDQGNHLSRLRAKQHLIFKLGYLVGRLGRHQVFVVYEDVEGFELPTDFYEVIYTPYDNQGHWVQQLVLQLRKTGVAVEATLK